MIRSGLVLLAAAATLSFGQRAAAAPYKVYAKYHLKSDTSKTIQVPLDPDVPLVRGASGVAFDGIYIQLDEQSKAELGSLRNFTVDFTCTDPDCKGTREMLSLDAASLKADNYAEKLVLPPAMFNGESAAQMVVLMCTQSHPRKRCARRNWHSAWRKAARFFPSCRRPLPPERARARRATT